MRRLSIFDAADRTPNAAMPLSRPWHSNLYLSLVDLGHDVVVFDYDLTPHFRRLDPSIPEHAAFIVRNRPSLERGDTRPASSRAPNKTGRSLLQLLLLRLCAPGRDFGDTRNENGDGKMATQRIVSVPCVERYRARLLCGAMSQASASNRCGTILC